MTTAVTIIVLAGSVYALLALFALGLCRSAAEGGAYEDALYRHFVDMTGDESAGGFALYRRLTDPS